MTTRIKQADQAILTLRVRGEPRAKAYRCPDVSVDQIIDAALRDDETGICVLCGEEQGPVAPDTKAGWCESCGCNGVYGAQELVIRLHNA